MKEKKNPNKILANRVRELRIEANLTQEQLGEYLNFTSKYIGDLENARRNITPQTAELMSKLFRCDPVYFLDESVKYKTDIEKFNSLLNEASRENRLIVNAICSLATLNGYKVEIKDIHSESTDEDVFSKMKNFIILKKDEQIVLSLSLADTNRVGNNISEIFMSNIKWLIKR